MKIATMIVHEISRLYRHFPWIALGILALNIFTPLEAHNVVKKYTLEGRYKSSTKGHSSPIVHQNKINHTNTKNAIS
jgi:hypothetical protein